MGDNGQGTAHGEYVQTEVQIVHNYLVSVIFLRHGYQIWPQSGSDWPQMGQIREIFRSDSVHFGAVRQNELNLI